jgi:hypothetical protein
MNVEPLTVKEAKRLVASWHRKHPSLTGAMWAVSLWKDGIPVGVAAVGRPKAKALQNAENLARRLELTRCAVPEGVFNGCSMLYAAASRAARAMGAWDLFTYTAAEEDGASLKASGWRREVDDKTGEPLIFGGGQWGVPSRPREKHGEDGPKHRWWTPWSRFWNKAKDAS